MNHLIDIGINLTNKQFKEDKKEVVQRAFEHNVKQLILTGTNLEKSISQLHFAKQYPNNLFSTAGYHPHDAKLFTEQSIHELRKLALHKEVVAFGECGLDYDRMRSTKEEQLVCFTAHLELARELKMPLFLHEREAHQDFVNILKKYPDLIERSVVHCFTGNEEEVKEYVEMGFYIGITGWICDDTRGKNLQQAVRHIPLDKLMIETDAPYLLPKNFSPKPNTRRNEPMYLPHIAKTIAHYIGVSEEAVIRHSTENATQFFALPKL